jgi:hypothetical protein
MHFNEDEIVEAFAATRGLTMPSQLRRILRGQGHDVHAEFLAMLPYRLPPIRIQRWSIRRLVLTGVVVWLGVLAVIMAIQLVVSSPL